MSGSAGSARETRERAEALASTFATVAPRLLQDVRASGSLAGADEATLEREWEALVLHALIRGVVAEGERSDEKADLVDALHDALLPRLAPAADLAARRAHLARRYGEYDGVTRTQGQAGAARVPAAVAAAFARHVRAADPAALAETVAPLLEALAEGAAASLAGAVRPDVALPPLAPFRELTARLDQAGLAWAVGASALLAALGLVDHVNDWDVQVDADPEPLRALYADVPHVFHGHGGCHADWKLAFEQARTELIPRFAFFVPGGVVRVPLAVSGTWRGLPLASPEGWACAYWLMGEYDEPGLRARRAERAALLFAHLERTGADAARVRTMLAEPLPGELAARVRALLPAR